MNSRIVLALALAVSATGLGCRKKVDPPAPPRSDPATVAPANAVDAPAAPTPAPLEAPAPSAPTPVVEAEPDPAKNAWNLPLRGTGAKSGDRCFVLTQGKTRSYADGKEPYRLFAHDIGEVKGDSVVIKELSGGTFKTSGLFIIASGSQPGELKPGDMVLAEWASELKHALVQKVEGDQITVRYSDLPDKWAEDQLVKVLTPREVTRQKEGLHPGNFAIAKGENGRDEWVLLVSESGDKWLARKFSQRVESIATSDLRPIPLKPALKPGQLVEVMWVGQMYPGKVVKVTGTRVEVKTDAAATKEPLVSSFGQVAPIEDKRPAPAKP